MLTRHLVTYSYVTSDVRKSDLVQRSLCVMREGQVNGVVGLFDDKNEQSFADNRKAAMKHQLFSFLWTKYCKCLIFNGFCLLPRKS